MHKIKFGMIIRLFLISYTITKFFFGKKTQLLEDLVVS